MVELLTFSSAREHNASGNLGRLVLVLIGCDSEMRE